jgi:hypothetical protein
MELYMKKIIVVLISSLFISSGYAQTAATGTTTKTSTKTTTAVTKSSSKHEINNEKHIKDLHTKLKITPEEESLWNTVAKTMRENAIEIDTAVDKRESMLTTATAIDDLNAYANIAQAHADSVKKLSMVFGPLYAAMSDNQKKIADEVFMHRDHDKKKS